MTFIPNKNNRYKIETPDGYKDFGGIQIIYDKPSLHITFEDGSEIRCSEKHPFRHPTIEGEIILAKELQSGSLVEAKNKNKIVSEIEPYLAKELYDVIEVDGHFHYTNDVVSHNCDFMSTSNTLIHPDTIRRIASNTRDPKTMTAIHKDLRQVLPEYIKDLHIYKMPINGHSYVIGVDSAKMTVDTAGDAICIQVLDVTRIPFKQVAVFYVMKNFYYLNTPEIINLLGLWYNQAMIFVENNEVGQEVANVLFQDYEYENLYFEKPYIPGYRTTKATKKTGLLNLKSLIEKDKIELYDMITVEQFSYFVKDSDTYKAEIGFQDDAVMALLHSLHFLQLGQITDEKYTFIEAVLRNNRRAGKEFSTEVSGEGGGDINYLDDDGYYDEHDLPSGFMGSSSHDDFDDESWLHR